MDLLPVKRYLVPEFLLLRVCKQAGKRMVIGLIEQFYLAVFPSLINQSLQGLDHVRLIKFGLLKKCAGHAERNLESAVARDKVGEHGYRGEVTVFRDLNENIPVLLLPQELISFRMEPERLMEVKAKCG